MSFVARLRASCAPDHDRVDALFGGYRLDQAGSYTRFLEAHARALAAAEEALSAAPELPSWRRRRTLIEADLAALGRPLPPSLPLEVRGGAAWGLLYVTEGSRLGGAMLARRVPRHLPSAYLSARHERGEWKRTLDALEARGTAEGEAWQDEALAGARAGFRLYEQAVEAG